MIIKNRKEITEQIQRKVGTQFLSRQLLFLLVAKVGLEDNNLKLALEAMVEFGLNDLDRNLDSDDLTRLLNSDNPALGMTVREMIQESFPKPSAKKTTKEKYLSYELFPQGHAHTAIEAFSLPLGSEPQNCDVLGKFQNKEYLDRYEYYLIKRRNGRLALLLISTSSMSEYAYIMRTGKLSKDNFTALKAKLSKG